MFIVGTRKSETAPNLAAHLKDCEAGFTIPDEEDFIVNYGRLGMQHIANLNANRRGDKLTQLQNLMAAGIKVPRIILMRNNPYDVPRYEFPLLARKVNHTKGKDIVFLRTRGSWLKRRRRVAKRQYFTKYIPKSEEFRVHILGDEIGGISKKVKNEESLIHHPHIWCRDKGWIQVEYEGEYYDELKELSIESLRVLELDFGAVDIIKGYDEKFYVLEVNTAPRLNWRRRKLYVKFFRKMWKKWDEEGE